MNDQDKIQRIVLPTPDQSRKAWPPMMRRIRVVTV
jgi:hypothetical protein